MPSPENDPNIADLEGFVAMSAQEAAIWQQNNPQPSIWEGWLVQMAVGLVVVAIAACGQLAQMWNEAATLSSAYGVLTALVPSAAAITGLLCSRRFSVNAGVGFAAVLFWEGVKVVLTIVALVLAPVILGQSVRWLGLVVGFVVVIKAYLLGLVIRW